LKSILFLECWRKKFGQFSMIYRTFYPNQCCGSGSGIRDWVPLWHLDPGSGMGESQDPDPGWTTRIIFFRV
jgi:hypothetical protein